MSISLYDEVYKTKQERMAMIVVPFCLTGAAGATGVVLLGDTVSSDQTFAPPYAAPTRQLLSGDPSG